MQFGILFLGVMLSVFFLFAPAPLHFNPLETRRVAGGPHAAEWHGLEVRHHRIEAEAAAASLALVRARHVRDTAASATAARGLEAAQRDALALRDQTTALIRRADPGAQTSDTNYVFLWFVLHVLPAGVVGLVLAAIFAASMNSSSSELNALASTSMVDVVHLARPGGSGRHDVHVSRLLTVGWAAFAVAFAEFASRLGSLIEAVNILGSLFYGTILGIFLTAFTLGRVGGRAVFVAALCGEACVLACFQFTRISFLWYNVVGCGVVMIVALVLSVVWPRRAAPAA
jgi:hypothetical protein